MRDSTESVTAHDHDGVAQTAEHRREPTRVARFRTALLGKLLADRSEELRDAAHVGLVTQIERGLSISRPDPSQLAAEHFNWSKKPGSEEERQEEGGHDHSRRADDVASNRSGYLFFEKEGRDRHAHRAEGLTVHVERGRDFQHPMSLAERP